MRQIQPFIQLERLLVCFLLAILILSKYWVLSQSITFICRPSDRNFLIIRNFSSQRELSLTYYNSIFVGFEYCKMPSCVVVHKSSCMDNASHAFLCGGHKSSCMDDASCFNCFDYLDFCLLLELIIKESMIFAACEKIRRSLPELV